MFNDFQYFFIPVKTIRIMKFVLNFQDCFRQKLFYQYFTKQTKEI
jgi:hypothetical protein